jgi:peptidoglycan L-alanyl-D-glutamate endopeptidase CwlK
MPGPARAGGAMNYTFSQSSRNRLKDVHPDLIAVLEKALSYNVIDFTVLPDGGARNFQKQKDLVAKGASQTLKSKHLIQKDGYGHAVDVAPYPVDFENLPRFYLMATTIFRAANELGVKIEWGGHWKNFKDYPHFQLVTKGA